MGLGFQLVELLIEKGAGVLDIVDVCRVAEAALTTEVFGWIDPAGLDGARFLVGEGHRS